MANAPNSRRSLPSKGRESSRLATTFSDYRCVEGRAATMSFGGMRIKCNNLNKSSAQISI